MQAKQLAREAGLPAERATMAVIAALRSPREFVKNYTMMDEAPTEKLASMNSTECDTLASTASLFPDSFVDSELGKIPRGWGVQSLNSAMDFLKGLALQKFPPANDGSDLAVLKIDQLDRGTLDEAKFVIPDDNLINTISSITTPLAETIISQNVMSKNLADLRDTLLPELINGNIDVS